MHSIVGAEARCVFFAPGFFAQAKKRTSTAEWLVKVARAPQEGESCCPSCRIYPSQKAKQSTPIRPSGTFPRKREKGRNQRFRSAYGSSNGLRGKRSSRIAALYTNEATIAAACFRSSASAWSHVSR